MEQQSATKDKIVPPFDYMFRDLKDSSVDLDKLGLVLDLQAISTYYTNMAFANDPVLMARHMHLLYKQNASFHRVVNQYTEQVFADAYVKPLLRNEQVSRAVKRWWTSNKWHRKMWRGYKQYIISGEQWVYMPRRSRAVRGRLLTPWEISQVKGYEPEDWESALYSPTNKSVSAPEEPLVLNPSNTAYFAHDALFDTLRGNSPFQPMYFALERYRRWLEARERITRVGGNVVGHLHFNSIEDAGMALGWKRDNNGNFVPQEVKLPRDGTVAVTVGENATFNVLTPRVGGADAEYDGRAFYNQANEGSRLPEYWSGDGRQVNVATAKVQYPIAIRSMLSIRDMYTEALADMLRLVLDRLVRNREISPSWTVINQHGEQETETVEDAVIEFSWPEIRELDFESEFRMLSYLYENQLLSEDNLLRMMGFDPATAKPGEIEEDAQPPESNEGEAAEARQEIFDKVSQDFEVGDERRD